MALISELQTKLTVDSKQFTAAMTRAAALGNQLGSVLTYAMKSAAFKVLAATAAFSGLLTIINQTSNSIERLADSGNKFNVSVASLQRLGYVAKLSGVEMSTVETGLARLVVTMKSAKDGNEGLAKAFAELGLSAESLDKLSLDQQYLTIAEAIKGIPDANRQAQLAVELFGKSGVEQLNLLRADVTGLSAEFDKFGGALSKEQVSAVESYGDSVDRLGAIFEVFKVQLTAQAAPALAEVVKWINETILRMGGLGPVANTAAQYFVSGLQIIVSWSQTVIDIIQSTIAGFRNLSLKIAEVSASWQEFMFSLGSGEAGDKLMATYDRIAKIQNDIKKADIAYGSSNSLQAGLQKVQGTLQAQAQTQQKVNVTITTEKGLKAEVAESPEITAQINKMIEQYAEASN